MSRLHKYKFPPLLQIHLSRASQFVTPEYNHGMPIFDEILGVYIKRLYININTHVVCQLKFGKF